MVVLVLHRQWLSIKAQEKQVGGIQTWTSPGVHSLRETLMLLHWLLLNDSSFSMHCLDVLHMYHQIIPGIRDTLRRIPDLTECEGDEIHSAFYLYKIINYSVWSAAILWALIVSIKKV